MSSRSYSSELRSRQAAATRERVVTAAIAVFSERGYAGTTMPEIARRAGVSTETVQAHGPKSALLRAAVNAAAFGGDDDTDARETELGALMMSAQTPADAAQIVARVLTQVNATVHGVWLAFSEAAHQDAALADELRGYAAGIRAQNVTLMGEWERRGFLRDDVPTEDLVDRAVVIGSVEAYDRAVRVGGLAPERYTEMLAALIVDTLLVRE